MTCIFILVFISVILMLLLSATGAHYVLCSESFSLLAQARHISHCRKLTTLGVEFGWEIDNRNESRTQIIVGTKLGDNPDIRWLAWGVNPLRSPQMIGTRAIIGIRHVNGSLSINTYNITSDTKLGCKLLPSEVEVGFADRKVEYDAKTDFFTIYAAIMLPSVYNISRLNHVWQVGLEAEELQPMAHPRYLQNVDSTETLDLKNSGLIHHVGKHENHLRTVHGILNIIGWGTFLPAGVIISRYLRYPLGCKDGWYYYHLSCQLTGYIVGTVGWFLGLWLGHASRYYTFRTHRLYSIFIFAFTTLQMMAFRFKPDEQDQYRKYWNLYHYCLGYALLVVTSVNIFHGINILKPEQLVWRWTYVGILSLFAILFAAFEIFTWTKFLLKPKSHPDRQRSS